MVVLDEAHKVKSTNGGIIANIVMDLSKWCSSRVILTGTPAPNGYEDLYNLFHFIWPQYDVIKTSVPEPCIRCITAEELHIVKVHFPALSPGLPQHWL